MRIWKDKHAASSVVARWQVAPGVVSGGRRAKWQAAPSRWRRAVLPIRRWVVENSMDR
jgi:hypothetical protein